MKEGFTMPDKPFTLLALSGQDVSREMLSSLTEGRKTLEFTLSYAPPYEDFRGIRELQLAVRRTGASPPEILVIDLTEWIAHEEEEYFEIAAMYLHDHRNLWNYVFLAREKDASECSLLFFTLRTFLDGRMAEDKTFSEKETLAAYLSTRKSLEPAVADKLAEILLKSGARMLRSYPRVDALLGELFRGERVSEARLAEAVSDPTSVLFLVAGRNANRCTVKKERIIDGENTI